MSRTLMDWVLVALFSGLLLVASLVPKETLGDDLRQLLKGKDKILHGIAYGVLAVFVCRALAGRGSAWTAYVIVGVLLATGYGALLEVLQVVFSHRGASVLDAGVNALGAGAGGLLWLAAVTGNTSRTEAGDCKS